MLLEGSLVACSACPDCEYIRYGLRRTIADFCCFAMPAANITTGAVSLDIFPHIERDLCSAQPWLVLHKARLDRQILSRRTLPIARICL